MYIIKIKKDRKKLNILEILNFIKKKMKENKDTNIFLKSHVIYKRKKTL